MLKSVAGGPTTRIVPLPRIHAVDRMPIRAKLHAGFGTILALLVGVAGVAFWGTSNLTGSADNIDVVVSHKLVVAEEMSAAAGDFHYSQTKYVLVGPSGREDFLADVGAFRGVLAQADRYTTDTRGRATLAGVKTSFADFMSVDSKMWAAVQAGHQRKALELVDASDEAVDGLTTKLDAFLNEAAASRQAAIAQLHSDGSTTRTVSVVLVIVALFAASGIAYLLTRRISGGLAPLRDRLRHLRDHDLTNLQGGLNAMAAEGDLSHEVTPVTTRVDVRGGDEIAALGEIFNDMLDHAQSTIGAYNSMRARTADMGRVAAEIGAGDLSSSVEPLSERDEFGNAFVAMHDYLIGIAAVASSISEGDLSTHVEARSDADQLGSAFVRMQAYLAEMADAAERLATRDLTASVTPRSEADVLGNAFARMTANMSLVISEVAAATRRVAEASTQVAAASDEAGRAVDEIATAVGEVAEGAQRQVAMIERDAGHGRRGERRRRRGQPGRRPGSRRCSRGFLSDSAPGRLGNRAGGRHGRAHRPVGPDRRHRRDHLDHRRPDQPACPECGDRGGPGRRAGARLRRGRRGGPEARRGEPTGRRADRRPDRRDPDRDRGAPRGS